MNTAAQSMAQHPQHKAARNIVFRQLITRPNLRDNLGKVYVFGDNHQRRGFGGQAKEMGAELNAIRVITKWKANMDARSFFDDTLACKMLVGRNLLRLGPQNRQGGVMPSDGIGTGPSRPPQHARNFNPYIEQWVNKGV